METIAKIKLSAGNVGWYEPLSRIHLTLARPIAEIKAGTKLDGIRKSLSYGTIVLIEGSLDEAQILNTIEQASVFRITPKETITEKTITEKTEKAIKETEAEEANPVEDVELENQELILDEKPKKVSKKKSKTEI